MSERTGADAGRDPQGAGGGHDPERSQDPRRSRAEWTTFGLSLSILAVLIGLVTYQHFTQGTDPAVIEVQPQLQALRQGNGAYYLPVEISNRGSMTAESVRVGVSLSNGQGRQESAEILIDFLPGGATEHGVVVFHDDPSRGNLAIDVVSFIKP